MSASGAATGGVMPLRAGERGALRTAVLASILLHALLLNVLPGWRAAQRPPEPAPILARVMPAPASVSRPGEPLKERAPPPPKSPAAAAKLPPPSRSAEPQREQVLARDAVSSAPVAPSPEREMPGAASESSTPVAYAIAAPAKSEAVPARPAPAIDGGTLAQYRLAVISLAKRFNRYPRIAIENGWQGRVEVRMSVAADGAIASVGLRKGSGHEILDRQALDMIGQAAPQVPLPPALRGREFAIDIPVIFSLAEAEG